MIELSTASMIQGVGVVVLAVMGWSFRHILSRIEADVAALRMHHERAVDRLDEHGKSIAVHQSRISHLERESIHPA